MSRPQKLLLGKPPREHRILIWTVAEERLPRGTFPREHRIPMQKVERRLLGTSLRGHQTHTRVEVEVRGVVGVEEEAGEVIIGEVRNQEGRMTLPVIGK